MFFTDLFVAEDVQACIEPILWTFVNTFFDKKLRRFINGRKKICAMKCANFLTNWGITNVYLIKAASNGMPTTFIAILLPNVWAKSIAIQFNLINRLNWKLTETPSSSASIIAHSVAHTTRKKHRHTHTA